MTPGGSRTEVADLTEELRGGHRPFVASGAPAPDLAAAGWVEVELAAEGVAGSFRHDGPVPEDGRFTPTWGPTARYRTRVVVRRPVDASGFSGTVVVEWLNVSGGLDADPDWTYLAPELMRSGVAWVGVSAQQIGVEGGSVAVDAGASGSGITGRGLKALDPERYATLDHPGDAFAYDIFTQVGAALRAGAPAALGDLVVRRILAVGESQAAFALTTYVNGIHPLVTVHDGYLLHSRGRSGLPLGEPGEAVRARDSIEAPPSRIRTDQSVPVMIFQTETDLLPVLGFADARQDDSEHVRLWEAAGTAHADATILGPFASMIDCGVPINDGPQRFVARAALRHLARWAGGGAPPPPGPRLVVEPGPDGARFPRDADGLAFGGIRLPQVEVPVAALTGEPGPVDSLICRLLGSTLPFPAARLAELYRSPEAYLQAYAAATDASIAAGFALAEDREEILADARPEEIPT